MLINNEFDETKVRSPLHYVIHIFKGKLAAVLAAWAVFLLFIIVFFAEFISSHSPLTQNVDAILLPPYWLKGGDVSYLLGTDDLGRDTFARLLEAIQRTLLGAISVTAAVTFFGILIGSLASSVTGFRASVLHHLLDSLLAIPILLTALILIVIFGSSFENCLFAIAISLLPQFIRSIFLSIETEMDKPYITALRVDGVSGFKLIIKTIYPNILEPLITIINRIFTMAVIEITTLGFLGFGVQVDGSELGYIIATNLDFIYMSPTLVLAPGLAIFVIIFVSNILAEGFRHAILEADE